MSCMDRVMPPTCLQNLITYSHIRFHSRYTSIVEKWFLYDSMNTTFTTIGSTTTYGKRNGLHSYRRQIIRSFQPTFWFIFYENKKSLLIIYSYTNSRAIPYKLMSSKFGQKYNQTINIMYISKTSVSCITCLIHHKENKIFPESLKSHINNVFG